MKNAFIDSSVMCVELKVPCPDKTANGCLRNVSHMEAEDVLVPLMGSGEDRVGRQDSPRPSKNECR